MKKEVILHLKSFMVLSICVFLAFGSLDVDENDPNYQKAKKKLEKEGIIPTEEELKQKKYWEKNIVGKWQLEKTVSVNSGKELKYQSQYKKSGDNVSIMEFTKNSENIQIDIGDYTVKNEPNGKTITKHTYLIQGKGITQILHWGKNGERTTTFYYDIISMDSNTMVLLLVGSKIDIQDYYEKDEMLKLFFKRIK